MDLEISFLLLTSRKAPDSVKQSPRRVTEGRPAFQQVSQKRHVCGFTTQPSLPI